MAIEVTGETALIVAGWAVSVFAITVSFLWRIWRKVKKTSTEVAEGTGRIEGRVDAFTTRTEKRLEAMERRVDEHFGRLGVEDLGKAVATLQSNFTEFADNIPDFDIEPLMQRLDALERGLPDMIGTHISMAIKGVQATEGKAIAKYVEELGIEGLTAEAQEAAVERLTTKQRLAYQLMTMKVPSKTKREHPVSSMVFEQSRGLVAQQLIESDSQVSYDNRRPAQSGGSDYNPGR